MWPSLQLYTAFSIEFSALELPRTYIPPAYRLAACETPAALAATPRQANTLDSNSLITRSPCQQTNDPTSEAAVEVAVPLVHGAG
jgi:hypothetical protein